MRIEVNVETGEITEHEDAYVQHSYPVDKEHENIIAEQNRLQAYRNESDPLFFKWQRGDATEQEWLDKVAEIKQRYPRA